MNLCARAPRSVLRLRSLQILLINALFWSSAAAVPAQPAPRKALTVERIWGPGQPSLSGSLTQGLQWSPDGKLLSYTQRSGQGREAKTDIWVMDVASGERRVLLDSEKIQSLVPPAAPTGGIGNQATGLGRLSPQQYRWSPKDDALLFIAQGNLYWFDLKTQAGKRLTSGKEAAEDPKFSPDGKMVSFVRGYDLWLVDIASGKESRLTTDGKEELLNGKLDWVYPEELDIRTGYWWSPDSTQIAFLQMDEHKVTQYPIVNFLTYTGETEEERYPKAGDANPVVRVGVISMGGGAPRWMDTGSETDMYLPRVNWLPDAKRLLIQRLNRAQNKLELLLTDVSTGKGQVILTEEDKHWINVHDNLYFFADGKRFLWSSERDGFRHLYLYDLSGKLLKQLTSGAWEVSGVTRVDEQKSIVYFTATQKTVLESHLYRVGFDGGAPTRLTKEDGSHSINMSPGVAYYVDTWSTAMTPSRQELFRADGTRALVINENKVAELAEYGLSPVEFLKVRGADGTELNAAMIKPPDFDPSKKYPVLTNLYAGPHAPIVRNAWGGANFLWHQMMAQRGYIIFQVDNRSASAQGHVSEVIIHRRFGETELADQLAGVAYLKSLPYVDGSRIGIWGWSYGGYMTCYAMLNAPDMYKAGFAGAPVTDWRQYDTIYTERYMSLPKNNAEGYKRSSPVTHAAKLKGKLLIAHGTGDDNVHYANTVQLMDEFIKAGKYPEVFFYPGRGHGISDSTARLHLFRKVTQFFLDNL
ncbi:MAG TPA: DPP IV N-terminal domain-containing protein [Candidatus Acidoferrales bacterium]|nr:DPP IV N-terminal domain-containing protein [Candidatus Acidoferrales bacterium]